MEGKQNTRRYHRRCKIIEIKILGTGFSIMPQGAKLFIYLCAEKNDPTTN